MSQQLYPYIYPRGRKRNIPSPHHFVPVAFTRRHSVHGNPLAVPAWASSRLTLLWLLSSSSDSSDSSPALEQTTHSLGPLLPLRLHSQGTMQIFSYSLPPSPHAFLWATNKQKNSIPGHLLDKPAWGHDRLSSLSFLFLIYNFPDSFPALHQTASRALSFLSSSTPWGPHRFSWRNVPPSYGPSQLLPSSLTLFIPVSFQSLELCSTWDHKWPQVGRGLEVPHTRHSLIVLLKPTEVSRNYATEHLLNKDRYQQLESQSC